MSSFLKVLVVSALRGGIPVNAKKAALQGKATFDFLFSGTMKKIGIGSPLRERTLFLGRLTFDDPHGFYVRAAVPQTQVVGAGGIAGQVELNHLAALGDLDLLQASTVYRR